ncbi:hypothetical protein [Chitinophaga sp. S165]|uniref:hypothetical protein n=1 Tax=Chitinophaga sp. S165 TaxID=2135462 RepID=UPI000D71B51D|nr:hypothetical protein [Chitinophaga sp. S165]PWV48116.1 hypothetical protein C7475_10722 [Chitinophaga sp. S165]
MKTGKILLVLIALVAIVGGLMAFGARKYTLNKMIAATTVKSDIQKHTLVTSSLGVTHVEATVRWADRCFSFTGTAGQYNDPSKYVEVECSTINVLCTGGAVFCGLKISDPNLIYDNGQFIDKPKVDNQQVGKPILDAIAEAVRDGQEAEVGAARAYLKN